MANNRFNEQFNGEYDTPKFALGHFNEEGTVKKGRNNGVLVMIFVRNPRAYFVSSYHFLVLVVADSK
jgi:hypothetical protein